MKKKYKVASIGELLWDILPSGKQLGGAPFNFAYHAKQAGCDAYVISAIGKDDLGREIMERVIQLNIYSKYIQSNIYPTGTVEVILDKAGQPDYKMYENVAWDFITYHKDMEKLSQKLDAVCFGSLAQRNHVSAETIYSFLEELNPLCIKVFDINLRQHYYNKEKVKRSLQLANILKLNNEELPILSEYFNLTGSIKKQLYDLMNIFNLSFVVYTMGSNGSVILSPDDYSEMKAPKVKVQDTVGAGDAFTATFISGILQKKSLAEIHIKATDIAAFVCTQNGAICEL